MLYLDKEEVKITDEGMCLMKLKNYIIQIDKIQQNRILKNV